MLTRSSEPAGRFHQACELAGEQKPRVENPGGGSTDEFVLEDPRAVELTAHLSPANPGKQRQTVVGTAHLIVDWAVDRKGITAFDFDGTTFLSSPQGKSKASEYSSGVQPPCAHTRAANPFPEQKFGPPGVHFDDAEFIIDDDSAANSRMSPSTEDNVTASSEFKLVVFQYREAVDTRPCAIKRSARSRRKSK
jgi:hypothetical protein